MLDEALCYGVRYFCLIPLISFLKALTFDIFLRRRRQSQIKIEAASFLRSHSFNNVGLLLGLSSSLSAILFVIKSLEEMLYFLYILPC